MAHPAPPGFLAPRAASALQPALSYGAAFNDLKELGLWCAPAAAARPRALHAPHAGGASQTSARRVGGGRHARARLLVGGALHRARVRWLH